MTITTPLVSTTICGAEGRMGQCLIADISEFPMFNLIAAIVKKQSKNLNKDCGEVIKGKKNSIKFSCKPVHAIAVSDLVIDVSIKSLVVDHSVWAAQSESAYLCGVTGLDKQTMKELERSARHIPLLVSDNFSLGINVLSSVLSKLSNVFTENNFDCDILETHHKNKIDAPSGTALNLAKAVLKGRKKPQGKIHHNLRQGKRVDKDINFAVRRIGGVFGEHEVMFSSKDEVVYLGHKALTRNLFSQGAFNVSKWLINQKPGLYSMNDWVKSLLVY